MASSTYLYVGTDDGLVTLRREGSPGNGGAWVPAVGFADTTALAKEVGGVIIVVKSGATSAETIKASKEGLEAAGASVVGAILNFAVRGESSHLRHKGYGPRRGKWPWRTKTSPPDLARQ